MLRHPLPAICALAVYASGVIAQDNLAGIPQQTFTLDPSHTSVLFTVNHLGFSQYTGGFDNVTGTLQLDPADPANAMLEINIDVSSIDVPSPPDGFRDELLGPNFFDAAAHPTITFTSDEVTLTDNHSAVVTGTLSLHGVSQQVDLDVQFNGNSQANVFEPWARFGFSGQTTISRTAFDMGYGVPPEGSLIGVGDAVTVHIETEWTGEVKE
ncbi:YceI family protein [Loktanella agnita]|uniref:YceI family protein n=1 Tax=Loktanella agnita TaxID=287097 RepID=UPI003985FB01